jgi:hypothetical protein
MLTWADAGGVGGFWRTIHDTQDNFQVAHLVRAQGRKADIAGAHALRRRHNLVRQMAVLRFESAPAGTQLTVTNQSDEGSCPPCGEFRRQVARQAVRFAANRGF